MAIQEAFGKIGFLEDFSGVAASATITNTKAGTRYNDITIVAISGDITFTATVNESGGVGNFTDAGGAGDASVITSSPMVPSSNGSLVVTARWKVSAVSDYRCFFGWQETVSLSETVNPFTLSGVSLTANNVGQVVGFYYDTQATTDGFRFMAASDGTASTTAAVTAREGSTTLGSLGILAGETLAAAAYMVSRVEIDPDGTARGYFGDESMGRTTGLTLVTTLKAGALDADAVYHPLLFMGSQSGTANTNEVDYFGAKGNRDWAL